MPPFLAGRQLETDEFLRLLDQHVVLENLLLTGLRGVGKTVLMDTFRPISLQQRWLWVGTDLSDSASLTEERIAIRLMADLSVITSSIVVGRRSLKGVGFKPSVRRVETKFDYDLMLDLYKNTPGLISDKLKAVLESAWQVVSQSDARGLIFAYDEAQNMQDHAAKSEYPLSLMLDVFQSIQKKEIPFMLLLTGLPTLFPKLVEARTFSERMFRVLFLDGLSDSESREAIEKPVSNHPIQMSPESVEMVAEQSGGYPYFIQFICREVYDVFLRQAPGAKVHVPLDDIIRKLDTDFYSARWARATDRQRELLTVAAHLPNADAEFTLQEVSQKSREILERAFKTSQIGQMFAKLADAGLVYKNRHGKYSFAVPLLGTFILRQSE